MAFWTDLLNRVARRQGDAGNTFPVEVTKPVNISGVSGTVATEDKQDNLINIVAGSIVKSGKLDDASVDTDKTIDTGGFTSIAVINDGPGELRVAIDEDSTIDENNIIYVRDSEIFADNIIGKKIHYSVSNHGTVFRYVLR